MRAVTMIASASEFLADAEHRRFREQAQARNAQIEDLNFDDPAGVSNALGSPSLFGDDRLLVLRGDVKAIERLLEPILAFAESPLEGTNLLIVTTSAKTLAKKLGTRVETIEIEPPKPWETAAWLARYAKGLGRSVKPDAAELLVETLGNDLRELATAVEQLTVGTSGPIDVATVAKTFQGRETALYTLLDDVLERNRAAALRDLHAILGAGDHPLVVHASLVKQFRALAAIWGRPKHDQPSAKDLDVSPGYLKRAVKAARNYDADMIRRAIVALAETDLALKGGFEGEDTPEDLVIELLVLELTASREERALREA